MFHYDLWAVLLDDEVLSKVLTESSVFTLLLLLALKSSINVSVPFYWLPFILKRNRRTHIWQIWWRLCVVICSPSSLYWSVRFVQACLWWQPGPLVKLTIGLHLLVFPQRTKPQSPHDYRLMNFLRELLTCCAIDWICLLVFLFWFIFCAKGSLFLFHFVALDILNLATSSCPAVTSDLLSPSDWLSHLITILVCFSLASAKLSIKFHYFGIPAFFVGLFVL